MYRRPKFLELLLEIREEMAREADHDIDQFVQNLHREVNGKADPPAADLLLNRSEIKRAAASSRKG